MLLLHHRPLEEQARQDSHPDRRGQGSPCSLVTPRALRERTTRIERASPDWRPGALPLSYTRMKYPRLESNQRPLPSRGSALIH